MTEMPKEIYGGAFTKGALGFIPHNSASRYAGWLFWKHPDGQWVTIAKIPDTRTDIADQYKRERDEALAEVERLKAGVIKASNTFLKEKEQAEKLVKDPATRIMHEDTLESLMSYRDRAEKLAGALERIVNDECANIYEADLETAKAALAEYRGK